MNLTPEELGQLAELQRKLRKREMHLKGSIEGFKAVVDAAWEQVTASVQEYNQVARNCSQLMEAVHAQMQQYLDEQPPLWYYTEAGQRFTDWMAEWSNEVFGFELEKPEVSVEPLDLSDAEIFYELPIAPK